MAIERILIADDELLVRSFLSETLRRSGLDTTCVENGKRALEALKKDNFDLVITDMKMPDITGLEVLERGRLLAPDTLFIVITAFGSIEDAVEAMRLGAFHYLVKPFAPDTIEAIIEKANDHRHLIDENQYLRSESQKNLPKEVIAASPPMQHVMEQVRQAAESQSSILITGESGTGKEVIASTIHLLSPRREQPFVKINCAAIPSSLIESELFGHEKGAFTGADARRPGRFELADKGTLLLDEVTEVPIELQAKLLRVIQEREFERLGGTKTIATDVRLISTSNRDLKKALNSQHLREDLYYRLNVIPIHLPPLRERGEDILPLTHAFLQRACEENKKAPKTLSKEAEQALLAYPFPGNVRELANIIERAAVMTPDSTISEEQLCITNTCPSPATQTGGQTFRAGTMTLAQLEEKFIVETFNICQENHDETASCLGIATRTLKSKLRKISERR